MSAAVLEGRHIILLMDTSASMKASDGAQGTRIATAIAEAKRIVRGMNGADVLMVVRMDAQVTPLSPFQSDEKALLASIKIDQWNEFAITCQGSHLVQKINGFTTVDVTDNEKGKSRAEGILALQLHAGPPMLVQFKDIQLKRLK